MNLKGVVAATRGISTDTSRHSMFTKTDTINKIEFVITASIIPNAQKGLTEIVFSTDVDSKQISKRYFVRNIEEKENIFKDFKDAVKNAVRENKRVEAYLEARGFEEETTIE